jgi:hypothetical protein
VGGGGVGCQGWLGEDEDGPDLLINHADYYSSALLFFCNRTWLVLDHDWERHTEESRHSTASCGRRYLRLSVCLSVPL